MIKAAFRNGPESSAVTIQRAQSKGSGSLKRVAERLLPRQDLPNGIVWSVVSSSELKIKALVSVKSFPLPGRVPSPHPPLIYILVLGLTQFLQEFFFHLPKLDTHRHFSYELLTAFLGHLLAVPQVNMTDISTAFEEGQALVSNLIAV